MNEKEKLIKEMVSWFKANEYKVTKYPYEPSHEIRGIHSMYSFSKNKRTWTTTFMSGSLNALTLQGCEDMVNEVKKTIIEFCTNKTDTVSK